MFAPLPDFAAVPAGLEAVAEKLLADQPCVVFDLIAFFFTENANYGSH